MNNLGPKLYWQSPTELSGRANETVAEWILDEPTRWSRRQFLEAAGFGATVLAVSGCGRAPTEFALPFTAQPEGIVPGRKRSYASMCTGCLAGCGLLVGVCDGRPLKMEGMPEHPLSHGGLCAVGQALPLGLYDQHRLKQPYQGLEPASWSEVDAAIGDRLRKFADENGAVRVVTPTVTSPTLQAVIDAFLSRFGDGRHVVLDAVSSSAILDAHQQTHGVRLLPHYALERAQVIVAFGADFLGTWISPVEFTAAWRTRRVPTVERPTMSYHVQLEGRMSLTGSNADRRYRLAPDEYGVVLSHLAVKLAALAEQPRPDGVLDASPLPAADIDHLADRLWQARGESLVICDSQQVETQRLVNFINHALGNYGKTLDVIRPSRQRQGNDTDVLRLVSELESGQVAALFVAGTDLTHNLPNRDALLMAIGKVPLVVSCAERQDDFSTLAHFVCPDHHPLESWADAEPISGIVCLAQPTLAPLGDTRSIVESFARWSGGQDSVYDIFRTTWEQSIYSRAAATSFPMFWDQAVHDGFVEFDALPVDVAPFRFESVALLAAPRTTDEFTLVLYSKVGMTDSRHAHNPWLQELPDPVTKVAWDNYVCMSQSVADRTRVRDGDLVRIATHAGPWLELPAFIQPGQHDRVLAVALAYGVHGTERFADIGPRWLESRPTVAKGERVGRNAAAFIDVGRGVLDCTRRGVTLERVDGHRDLASTQGHHWLELPKHVAPYGAKIREPIQETTLASYTQDPAAGAVERHHTEPQLWSEDHPRTGHSWGMVVDLNACTGCSACLIACQAENNVPVVGKDEVRRAREMHWIRIDRYYSGTNENVEVSHQPMMCQHCGNAPCETVCPVLATVHSEEGLNQQTYNRCVGTRYCANNCPYKVRRFNWFRYHHDDLLQNLALNPDVTVRSRGVMEKCSMCVQRIEDGKIEAKRLGQAVADGAIQTACQQSCPAQAITFGDVNDAAARVRASLDDPRQYALLDEFNFRPSVAYLRVVRNREAAEPKEGNHV